MREAVIRVEGGVGYGGKTSSPTAAPLPHPCRSPKSDKRDARPRASADDGDESAPRSSSAGPVQSSATSSLSSLKADPFTGGDCGPHISLKFDWW